MSNKDRILSLEIQGYFQWASLIFLLIIVFMIIILLPNYYVLKEDKEPEVKIVNEVEEWGWEIHVEDIPEIIKEEHLEPTINFPKTCIIECSDFSFKATFNADPKSERLYIQFNPTIIEIGNETCKMECNQSEVSNGK